MDQAEGAPWAANFTEEQSREFATYWSSLPKIGLIPSRGSFRPEDVPRLLPRIVIHELVSPEMLRLRLVGSAVVEDYGQEFTGRNYLDFVEEQHRAAAARAIFLVCEQPAGLLVKLRSVTKSGRVMIRESIGFPMRDDDGRANLVYFCSTASKERDYIPSEPDELRVVSFTSRTFVDIGAGLPDFQD